MNRRWMLAPAAALLVVVAACSTAKTTAGPRSTGSTGSPSPVALPTFGSGRDYHPVIVAADFSADVTNPWFPLKPGSRWTYTGTKDDKSAKDIVVATEETKVIAGVPCRVVKDELFLDGKLEERTSDYYSQDRSGNVWYFGEDTAVLDSKGKVVDTEGSWHTGVDGAEPGVFMQADPQIGVMFRQEWYKGQAEDQFSAVDLAASVTVPFGSYATSLRTEETTSLEPDIVDNKYYAMGIGEIEEIQVKGPPPIEKLVLVAFASG